jgi:two-component system sensor histidine kinase RpfC
MLKTYLRLLRKRLKSRTDSEHEQAVLRIVIAVLVLSYMAFNHTGEDAELLIQGVSAFLVFGAALLVAIVIWPAENKTRRIVGMVADSACTTFCVALSGEVGVAIFGVYLFISFGNGFRYGRAYLFACQAMCLAGFLWVMLATEYWARHRIAGWGLFIALVVLPLYVSTLLKRIHAAQARAEEANRAKTTFLANMSHEMRTPLNGVVGVVDLFQMTELSAQQGELVRLLRHSVSVLRSLIDDVLDISKIEAGRLTLEVGPFDLHAALNTLIDLLRPHAHAKGLSLHAMVDPQLDYHLRGDSHHLRQVLLNLLGNAIKFTERGEVLLSVTRVKDTPEGVTARFEVRDTGIGIAPEALQRVFERFAQADESVTRRYGGTGLGTTIAKQLVELMGGTIGVESKLGEGSLFWFELPLLKEAAPASVAAPAEALDEGVLVALSEGPASAQRLASLCKGIGYRFEAVAASQPLGNILEAHADARAIVTTGSASAACSVFASVRQRLGDRPIALIFVGEGAPSIVDAARIRSMPGGFAFGPDVTPRLIANAIHAATATSSTRDTAEIVDLAEVLRQQRRNLRILVAEDNPTNQTILRQLLEKAGHTVLVASDGDEALDLYESEQPELAILDFNMPQRTGLEVITAIRMMEPTGTRMPAMMLSASVTIEARERAKRAGADDFLGKPFEAASLLQAVDRLARRTGRTNAASSGSAATPMIPKTTDPLIDRAAMAKVERITGDATVLKQLLDGFRSDVETRLDRLDAVIAEGKSAAVVDYTHPIKGAAVSVGAMRLAASCNTVEAVASSGNVAQLGRVAAEMRKCYQATMAELDTYLVAARSKSR